MVQGRDTQEGFICCCPPWVTRMMSHLESRNLAWPRRGPGHIPHIPHVCCLSSGRRRRHGTCRQRARLKGCRAVCRIQKRFEKEGGKEGRNLISILTLLITSGDSGQVPSPLLICPSSLSAAWESDEVSSRSFPAPTERGSDHGDRGRWERGGVDGCQAAGLNRKIRFVLKGGLQFLHRRG